MRLQGILIFVCCSWLFSKAEGNDDFSGLDNDEYEVTSTPGDFRAPKMKGVLEIPVEHAFSEDSEFLNRQVWEMSSSTYTRQVSIQPREQPKLSTNLVRDRELFKELLLRDGFYRIRFPSNPLDPESPKVMAAINACDLLKANFREEITLHLDVNQNIIGLSYSAPTSLLVRDCYSKKLPQVIEFVTTIKIAENTPGQSVPLQAIADAPPPGLLMLSKFQAKKDGEGSQNQSFLRKYWYIVVPLVILFMSSGGAPGEEQRPATSQSGA